MRPVPGARSALLAHRRARGGGERAPRTRARSRARGDVVAVRALVLGGARSGKSAFAEDLAFELGGADALYVATAVVSGGDEELRLRVRAHQERRSAGWGLLELSGGGLEAVLDAARGYGAVLFDSLTLWVSARMYEVDDEGTLEEISTFLTGASALSEPLVIVSDEVGLGLVPESAEGRRFRDLLGTVNQRVASEADEVHLCVAGMPLRIK